MRSRRMLVWTVCAMSTAVGHAQLTLSVDPVSSGTYPAGTQFRSWISSTADPLGHYMGESVFFLGWRTGGSSQVLGDAHLVYRIRIDSNSPISLVSISMTGAGDHTGDSVLRVLDSGFNVIGVTDLTGLNQLGTWTVNLPSVRGATFYLEEYDRSTTYRWRELLEIIYVGAPAATSTATAGSAGPTSTRSSWPWEIQRRTRSRSRTAKF